MVERNYTKEAIDVLETYPLSQYSPLIVQILKDNPSAIVKAHEGINASSKPWMEWILHTMRSGHKLKAIKQLRALTDMELKDAKITIDKLQE